MLLQKYILNININFFFFNNLNIFCLSNKFFIFFLRLPSFYFYILKKNLFIFFFINKFFFKSFLSHLKSIYISFYFFFFFKYKLRGLGYRVKHITFN